MYQHEKRVKAITREEVRFNIPWQS